jgi:V/A-type H+/Na+-transporting ATPase subunit D
MMRGGMPASRSNVMRYRRRLVQVRRGAALLTRKRQALIAELLGRARVAITTREEIDAQAQRAWEALMGALGALGSDGLMPLAWPTRQIEIDVHTTELWGLRVVEMTPPTLVRSLAARGLAAGPDDAAVPETARAFELLLERLLAAAPQEHLMRRLGHALGRTTRLVNTLEQRVAVRLESDVAAMQQILSEREREEHVRIKRLMARRRH